MITALIDGDWLAYTAGFASQKTRYVVPAMSGSLEYDNMTAVKDAGYLGDEVYSRVIVDPIDHVLHTVKHMLESQLTKIHDKFKVDVKPVVLLDGSGNFREQIATIKQYKGNRPSDGKPKMHREIRTYLIYNWGAELVHGQETDDEMAIRQAQSKAKTIIVAVDKDMLQVPGWHLNPNKGFKHIGPQEALERLYVQCLTGDSVDNIGGCYKIGPKGAQELIIGKKLKARHMYDLTLGCYYTSMERYGDDIYGGLDAEAALLENMRLVYLRREPGEMWNPPAAKEKQE